MHPNQISAWKAIALKGLPTLFEKDNAAQVAEKAAQEQKVQELNDYDSPRRARQGLSRYFPYYNQERLHQALNYKTSVSVYLQE